MLECFITLCVFLEVENKPFIVCVKEIKLSFRGSLIVQPTIKWVGKPYWFLACEASVSVLFWSKGHAKNGASKRGGGGDAPPPSFIFCLSFHFSGGQTENLVPRSFFSPKQHGNACYAG